MIHFLLLFIHPENAEIMMLPFPVFLCSRYLNVHPFSAAFFRLRDACYPLRCSDCLSLLLHETGNVYYVTSTPCVSFVSRW